MTTNELACALGASYSQHPSFHFGEAAFTLDDRLLEDVSESYAFLVEYAGLLNRRDGERALLDCDARLGRVFDALDVQAKDPGEALFLSELRAECRRLMSSELAYVVRRGLRAKVETGQEGVRRMALALKREKFFFASLSSESVQEINAIGRSDLERLRENARRGAVTRDDLSIGTGPTTRAIADALTREYSRMGVLDAVNAYEGREMYVSGVAFELSVPHSRWWKNHFEDLSRGPATMYAHIDESVTNPKSIVYLTDVGPKNGPTSCYPGVYEAIGLNPMQSVVGRVFSHVGANPKSALHAQYNRAYHQTMSSKGVRRHFMRLPAGVRFNSHLGWDVLPGSEFEKAMAAREASMQGPAGRCIVFDGGRLFHRGGLIESGERVALQVVFSQVTRKIKFVKSAKKLMGRSRGV